MRRGRGGRGKRWNLKIDRQGPVTAADGIVVVPTAATLFAMRLDTGATVWRATNPGGYGDYGMQYGAGLLYVEGGDGEVLAYEAATGKVIWRRRLATFPNDPRRRSTALSPYGDALYVTCVDAGLFALNSADGRVRWRYTTLGPLGDKPSVAGLVFVRLEDGFIQAIAPPVQWTTA